MARRNTEQLAEVRDRLVRWRERHGGRGRPIPAELWAEAAAVAGVEGVEVTAQALGVDRVRLARRVSQGVSVVKAPSSLTPSRPTFVELPTMQSPPHGHLVVRLTGRDGEQMEIIGDVEVVGLVREFWNRARCSS